MPKRSASAPTPTRAKGRKAIRQMKAKDENAQIPSLSETSGSDRKKTVRVVSQGTKQRAKKIRKAA